MDFKNIQIAWEVCHCLWYLGLVVDFKDFKNPANRVGGATKTQLGPSWMHLERVLGPFGGLLACLGRFLEPRWPPDLSTWNQDDSQTLHFSGYFGWLVDFKNVQIAWEVRQKRSLDRLGCILTRSWARLGASWPVLDAS